MPHLKMPVGKNVSAALELFARTEKVDLAEKDAHEALAHSNDAEIAYLRKPNNHTRVAFEQHF